MRDVRINKDVPIESNHHSKEASKLLDFRDKKVSPIIITFVQVTYIL